MTREKALHIILLFLDSFLLSIRASVASAGLVQMFAFCKLSQSDGQMQIIKFSLLNAQNLRKFRFGTFLEVWSKINDFEISS